MHGVDLTATLLAAAGVTTDLAAIDGIDHRAALFAPSAATTTATRGLREHVPINVLNMLNGGLLTFSALRLGDMKLIIGDGLTPLGSTYGSAMDGWFRDGLFPGERPPSASHAGHLDVRVGYLFNITSDPEERTPLEWAAYPRLVTRMREVLVGYAVAGDYREPQHNVPTTMKYLPRFHDGTWAPFLDDDE